MVSVPSAMRPKNDSERPSSIVLPVRSAIEGTRGTRPRSLVRDQDQRERPPRCAELSRDAECDSQDAGAVHGEVGGDVEETARRRARTSFGSPQPRECAVETVEQS